MKLYRRILIGSLVLTLIMAVKDIALAVLMMTLGLALPLVFAATVLVYTVCAYPAVALWNEGPSARAGGLLGSVAMIALVALTPSLLGQWQASRIARAWQTHDVKPSAPAAARTIEIRRPIESYDKTFSGNEACGSECRRVLSSGRIEWIRVVMGTAQRRDSENRTTLHVARRGSACEVPGGSAMSPEQVCIIQVADSQEAADLVIDFQAGPASFKPSQTGFVELRAPRTVVARTGTDIILRQTEVRVARPYRPLIVGPRIQGMSSSGAEIQKRLETYNQITLAGIIEKLGLPLGDESTPGVRPVTPRDWRQPLDDTMTRELLAVLDLPTPGRFGTDQMRVVSQWVMHARSVKEWTPELIGTLRRMLHDQRIEGGTFFDQIFERNPAVTTALMPDVLQVLEQRNTELHTMARSAAWAFVRIDPAFYQPHTDEILRLISKGGRSAEPLTGVVGRLGIDPTPYLLPLGGGPNRNDMRARIRGSCMADKQWAPILIPALRDELPALSGARGGMRDQRQALLRALASLGDGEFVETALAQGDKDDDRLRRRINADLTGRRGPHALCQS